MKILMNKYSRLLCITFLISSTTFAGDGRVGSETPRNSMIPFWGDDSEIFIAGIRCRNFKQLGKGDQCAAENDCLALGEPILRKKIASSNSDRERAGALKDLAILLTNEPSRLGESLLILEEAHTLLKPIDQDASRITLAQMGMVQLRIGENNNCITNHNAESCLFPLRGKAVHSDKTGARSAFDTFMKYLEQDPENEHIRWLLNISAMALGEYPKKVPAKFLIAESLTKSDHPFPEFTDIGGPAGVQRHQRGAGSTLVDDINGDGLLDIIFAPRLDLECIGLVYYENDGKGGFADKSKSSGLGAQVGVTNLILADYNNDGIPDLYLIRGGWQEKFTPRVFNTLMQGLGKGKFKDVTKSVGLRTSWNASVSSNWVDFDRDGWIDLFVCNEGREVELFRNQKGKFSEIAQKAGISSKATCKGSAWGDVNGDGWPDLFITNYGKPNRLYLNQGGKSFKQDHQPLVEAHPTQGFATWFFDVDNDGDQDLFVTANNRDMKPYVRALLGKDFQGDISRLFLSNGGKFSDASKDFGFNLPILGMAANYGDFNGDGWPDIYIGTGSISFGDLVPNHAYLNLEGKKFVDITSSINMGNLQKGHGIAFADMENRGNQDVVANFGGAFRGDKFFPSLYKNPGFQNSWITLRLEGTKSNRSAIGAQIKVRVRKKNGELREIYKQVGPGGSFGSNPLRAEIGLGDAREIIELEVLWPNLEGTRTKIDSVPLNSIYSLKEGEIKLRPLNLPKLRLKRSATKHGAHH